MVGRGEIVEASLVATAEDSLVVGTMTGGRLLVEAAPLAVVSVDGSKTMVLEITTVVTLPSARVAVDSDTEESVAPEETSWVDATVDVGEGDVTAGISVEEALDDGF